MELIDVSTISPLLDKTYTDFMTGKINIDDHTAKQILSSVDRLKNIITRKTNIRKYNGFESSDDTLNLTENDQKPTKQCYNTCQKKYWFVEPESGEQA